MQIDPAKASNRAFAGCMLVVTQPKSFGAQGYVQALGEANDEPGGLAFIRVRWDEIEFVGRAVWMAR